VIGSPSRGVMQKTVLVLSSFLLVLVLFLPQAFCQPSFRPTLSVMNLKPGAGVSGQDALLLTDRLLTELDRLGLYDITARAKRDELLQAAGFRETGYCDEADCLARAGTFLGVQKMVGGSVELSGSTYNVTLILVNVETGWVDNVVVKNYAAPMDSLLASGVKEAAWEVAESQRLIVAAGSRMVSDSLAAMARAREEQRKTREALSRPEGQRQREREQPNRAGQPGWMSRRNLAWTSLGLGAASVVGAFFEHQQSGKDYDRYNAAADVTTMNLYKQKVKNADLRTNVLIGVATVCLGTSGLLFWSSRGGAKTARAKAPPGVFLGMAGKGKPEAFLVMRF
jgi:hypothetical protein